MVQIDKNKMKKTKRDLKYFFTVVVGSYSKCVMRNPAW